MTGAERAAVALMVSCGFAIWRDVPQGSAGLVVAEVAARPG